MSETTVETTVSVTAADIRRGVRRNPLRCPVARALRRATGKKFEVALARATCPADGETVWLPAAVTRFVEAFDGGCEVRPFRWSFLGAEGGRG